MYLIFIEVIPSSLPAVTTANFHSSMQVKKPVRDLQNNPSPGPITTLAGMQKI